ncbi:MAG: hypothetical protein ACHP9Z_11770 [Streptosporangiales bacterium]
MNDTRNNVIASLDSAARDLKDEVAELATVPDEKLGEHAERLDRIAADCTEAAAIMRAVVARASFRVLPDSRPLLPRRVPGMSWPGGNGSHDS